MTIEQLLLLKKDLLRQKRQNAKSLKAMQAEVSELYAQLHEMGYSEFVKKWTKITEKYIGAVNKFYRSNWHRKMADFSGTIHLLIHEGFYQGSDSDLAWEVDDLITSTQTHISDISSKMRSLIIPFAPHTKDWEKQKGGRNEIQ